MVLNLFRFVLFTVVGLWFLSINVYLGITFYFALIVLPLVCKRIALKDMEARNERARQQAAWRRNRDA